MAIEINGVLTINTIYMEDNKSFDELMKEIKEKKEKAAITPAHPFNPQETIDKYRKRVEELYSLIADNWLHENVEDGLISLKREPVTIREERLGEYKVDSLIITIDRNKILLKPYGTILIGTRGRIDISCRMRSGMFILTGENVTSPRAHIVVTVNGEKPRKSKEAEEPGNEVWKFVDRSGMMRYVSLDKKTFQQILMALMNG